MFLFRSHIVRRTFALITGLVFLNMSFFLTELNVLNVNQENKALYESLIATFSSLCEEEKDPFGEESSETETLNKELDLLLSMFETESAGYFITLAAYNPTDLHFPCDGASGSIHQPPEQRA